MAMHRISLTECWLFILFLASLTFVAASSLTLEQRVDKLEKDYVSEIFFNY